MLAALRDGALQTICVHLDLSDHDIIAIQFPCDGELRTDTFASTHFQDKRVNKLRLPEHSDAINHVVCNVKVGENCGDM